MVGLRKAVDNEGASGLATSARDTNRFIISTVGQRAQRQIGRQMHTNPDTECQAITAASLAHFFNTRTRSSPHFVERGVLAGGEFGAKRDEGRKAQV